MNIRLELTMKCSYYIISLILLFINESYGSTTEFLLQSTEISNTTNVNANFPPTSDPSFPKGKELSDSSLWSSSDFIIEKDLTDPTTLLNVVLPVKNAPFKQYIAKVVDISTNIDPSERDVNRTFLAAPSEFRIINIHGLHPGHKYSISIIGRNDGESELIKEESFLMNPVAPDFGSKNASIMTSFTNITLRAIKPYKAVQDTFRVIYSQSDPKKLFPNLEVHDIAEQRFIEIYLGNLNPGRDYEISITPIVEDIVGQPWKAVLTTKPYAPSNLAVVDTNSSCITVAWNYSDKSGVDQFSIAYNVFQDNSNVVKVNSVAVKKSKDICVGLTPGQSYKFTIWAEKSSEKSESVSVEHTLKPLPPENLHIYVDYQKRKFIIMVDIVDERESFVDGCLLNVSGDNSESNDKIASVDNRDANSVSKRKCHFYVNMRPGRRYEVIAKTKSRNITSRIISRSFALQPAFDMNAFGIDFKEENDSLALKWPATEIARVRLFDIWENVVGNDSSLHIRVDPMSSNGWHEQPIRYERHPHDLKPLRILNLRQGACYKVQIYTATSSGIVSAEKFMKHIRLDPPIISLLLKEKSKDSAIFRATEIIPRYSDCNFYVNVTNENSISVYNRFFKLTSALSEIILDGLRPYHKYSLKTQVICGQSEQYCPIKIQEGREIPFETLQDRPGPVQNLSYFVINPYSLQLSWNPPALPNGIITHYTVRTHPMKESLHDWAVNVRVPLKQENDLIVAVIDKLIGGLRYRIDVSAVTEAGEGDRSAASDAINVQMPISAPPKPSSQIEILKDTINSNEVTISYSTLMFNNKHGYISTSMLLVQEVGDENGQDNWMLDRRDNKTLTWRMVRKFSVWPVYAAIEKRVDERDQIYSSPHFITEVIGSDITCADVDPEIICNGPLKSSTAYRFKIRLFTAPHLWTDSEYSDNVITKPKNTLFAICLAILSLVILFCGSISSILFLLVWRKRRKSCPPTYGSGQNSKESQWTAFKMMMAERAADCLAKLGLDSQHSTTPSCMNSNDIQNKTLTANYSHRRCRSLRERTGVDQRLERLPSGLPPGQKCLLHTVLKGCNPEKSRPVLIADFPEHVQLMSADSDFRFSEEYDDLKMIGNGQPCIAADLTVNRAKNRFTNILPYDHSRVKLKPTDDEDGSDYVNASYIPGFNSRREFIAAQGPLPSTRDHFWRLVWEQQCPAIVALTKCVEKGRDKCHQYWPDNDQPSVLYADIEVTLLNEVIYDEFTVRDLQLVNMLELTQQIRIVKHLHYMAWPDFGVPENAAGLVQFVRIFRERLSPSSLNKPSIVHCSAGVGRSGTFIALDRLLQMITSDRPLDIFGIVYEMRMERCHMVQNEQQYIFIHKCLLYVLEEESGEILNHSTGINFFGARFLNNIHVGASNNQNVTVTLNNFANSAPVIETPLPPIWPVGPRIEVHQNPAFEDDDGIAESGL